MNSQNKWNIGHYLLALMVFMAGIYYYRENKPPKTEESQFEPPKAVNSIPGQLYADQWGNSAFCPKTSNSEGNVTVTRLDEQGIKYLVTANGFDQFKVEFWFEYGNYPDPDRVVVQITDQNGEEIDSLKDWLYPEWENRYLFIKTQSGETVYFYLPVRGGQIDYGVLESNVNCK